MSLISNPYFFTLDLLNRKGLWSSKSEDEKIDLLTVIFGNYIYYNPYEDAFCSIVTGKTLPIGFFEGMTAQSMSEVFSWETRPEKDDFNNGLNKVFRQRNFHIYLLKITSKLKYIALIAGALTYFVQFKSLALFLFTFLLFWEFGFFTFRNAHIEKNQEDFNCAMNYRKYKLGYTVLSWLLLISAFYFFNQLVGHLWISIVAFIVHFFIFIRVVNKNCSNSYTCSTGINEMMEGIEEYERKFTPPSSRKETFGNQ